MSEYQYYEFQSIDQILTSEQKAYLHSLSSRAEVSSNSAIYTYSYRDFPADAMKVLATHFDALLYLANWGSRQLAFRFPRNAIKPEELKAYLTVDEISLEPSGDYFILNIDFNPDDGSGEWIEGEGLLSSLVSLRNDIVEGDLRALYLAWLQAATYYDSPRSYNQESDDDEEYEDWDEDSESERADGDPDLTEPPIPAGLKELTPPLRSLIEFLDLDMDLVKAAAKASPPRVAKDEPIEEWVTKLSIDERNAFLVRVARRDPRAYIDLRIRLREVGQDKGTVTTTTPRRRHFSEIRAAAQAEYERRLQKEREAAERKRLAELEQLAKREPEAWREVAENLARRNASGYDSGVALLVQLHTLALHRNQLAAFETKFSEITGPFLKSKALQDRLRAQGFLG